MTAASTYGYRGLFLLHFEPAYEHARHYLGYAKRDLQGYARAVAQGRQRAPHPLVERAQLAGVEMTVVDVWPAESRATRRKMRRSGGLSRFCPVCRAEGAYHR